MLCGGEAVSWFSRTQECVTHSSLEVGYVALRDAMNKALSPRDAWCFRFPGRMVRCIRVFQDNMGALQLASNAVSNSNLRHIDVLHHVLRELGTDRNIVVIHVMSEYQHVGFLTKALGTYAFRFHRDVVMNMG